MINNLLMALNKGMVKIYYKSINSGRIIEGYYTLKNRNVGISPKTDTFVAWDLEREIWQDIRSNTVEQWMLVEEFA